MKRLIISIVILSCLALLAFEDKVEAYYLTLVKHWQLEDSVIQDSTIEDCTITGGTIDDTDVGGTTPGAGTFTTLIADVVKLPITTTIPSGNLTAVVGAAMIYNNGGAYTLYVNDDGAESYSYASLTSD